MSASNQCPSFKEWTKYLQGESQTEEADLTAHLDSCSSCRQILETLSAADSILDVAKKVGERAEPIQNESKRQNPSAGQTAANSPVTEMYSNPDSPSAPSKSNPIDTIDGNDILHVLTRSDNPDAIGKLHHYDILEVVGTGGMGSVFRAFDEKLHRVVAIKTMSLELAASASARQRFIREARAAAAVTHEHVVAIHAIEEERRPPYLVMQFVDGMSLQEKLDNGGALSIKETWLVREASCRFANSKSRNCRPRSPASNNKRGVINGKFEPLPL